MQLPCLAACRPAVTTSPAEATRTSTDTCARPGRAYRARGVCTTYGLRSATTSIDVLIQPSIQKISSPSCGIAFSPTWLSMPLSCMTGSHTN